MAAVVQARLLLRTFVNGFLHINYLILISTFEINIYNMETNTIY